MKLFKKQFVLLFILALLIVGLVGCSEKEKVMKVAHLHGTFDINVDNVNEVVGDADNVFVGYVDKIEGTEYKFPVTVETENGTKEVTSPYTNYSITVVDNIKGRLKKNNSIPMQKSGGISEDSDIYILYEDDSLPEEGKYYIFNTYNQPDGSILISGPNSNIVLNVTDKSEIVSSKEYKKYKEAVKNEVKTDRKRFSSKYSN
ncbi:cell surface protein [Robertmurraya beringensis]|uniref:Cell surface protein n=1 Tax=Robertmurraya beringensis TaxID=641660 RepID=A0ABV6KQF9_9BACI